MNDADPTQSGPRLFALGPLEGARVRRIDAPTPELFAFTLAAPSLRSILIVSLSTHAAGLGLVEERPRGASATSFVQKLRKEIEGGRIMQATLGADAALVLHLTRGDGTKQLRIDFGREPANLVLLGADAQLLIALHDPGAGKPARGPRIAWPDTFEALQHNGAALITQTRDGALDARRRALLRGVAGARKRLQRKRADIAEDAKRAEQAPELRARATLVMANLAQIPRGASRVALLDYTHDPPRPVDLELEPKSAAREQAELWFKRARRFERGATLAIERLAQLEPEQAELDALEPAIAAAEDDAAFEALIDRARKLGAQAHDLAAPTKSKHKPPTRKPYREFRGAGDRPILVGRGAADNDELTLRHARPHDLWLHARDTAGAHVVIPLERNESTPPQLLADAALLAAHFSSDKQEPAVDISYTQRRHITKPKGSPPGSVTLTKEKVFRLKSDPPRLEALLRSELK